MASPPVGQSPGVQQQPGQQPAPQGTVDEDELALAMAIRMSLMEAGGGNAEQQPSEPQTAPPDLVAEGGTKQEQAKASPKREIPETAAEVPSSVDKDRVLEEMAVSVDDVALSMEALGGAADRSMSNESGGKGQGPEVEVSGEPDHSEFNALEVTSLAAEPSATGGDPLASGSDGLGLFGMASGMASGTLRVGDPFAPLAPGVGGTPPPADVAASDPFAELLTGPVIDPFADTDLMAKGTSPQHEAAGDGDSARHSPAGLKQDTSEGPVEPKQEGEADVAVE